jgi:hypothetical protein
LDYYTPEMASRAKRVFGPYMKKWGYEIPSVLGDDSISLWSQIEFKFFTFLRMLYWKYFRGLAYPESIRKVEQPYS